MITETPQTEGKRTHTNLVLQKRCDVTPRGGFFPNPGPRVYVPRTSHARTGFWKVCFRLPGEHPAKVGCCSITYDVVAVEFKHRARGIEDSSDEVEGFGEAADDSGVGEAVETNTYKEVCG